MNRRGFLRAVSATGLMLMMPSPAVWAADAPQPTVEEQLRQALAGRHVVQFKYHGYSRRVEPHALGQVSEGRIALLGWQASGGSASEPPPGWRTFVLAEIQSLRRLRKNFTPRPDYRPATTKLSPITAEVGKAPAPPLPNP